jgi:hypothetical protein
MSFNMGCPKCGTINYSIEKERSTYSRNDPVASLVFACTCGKRLYGKQVEEEYLRQKKLYEQNAEYRAREAQQRERAEAKQAVQNQALNEAMAYRARFEASKKAKAEADAVRTQQKEVERWQEQHTGGVDDPMFDVLAAEGVELCAWLYCDKGGPLGRAVRRKGSKYCSRDCSNKNARWRHKQRKVVVKIPKS